jgi:ubiquinone/menaquinone biosynthesis C-methylase UbiE
VAAVLGDDWRSYDTVAGEYDLVWRPNFERVARDVVDLVGLTSASEDAVVLDVGTGTGVMAAEVARSVPRGLVVGIDPSIRMLTLGRARTPLVPAAAEVPGLPFPDGTFHAAVANLVLSHFTRYDISLADVVRVLRPGGLFGVTAWGSLDDDPVDDGQQRELTGIWKSVAARYVDADDAEDAIAAAIPWEAWFGDPAHLRGALEASGLRAVALHARIYRLDVTQRHMLAGYETSFSGRYVRHTLSDTDWHRFKHEVAETVRAALPDPMTRVDQLLIAVGSKAFDSRP